MVEGHVTKLKLIKRQGYGVEALVVRNKVCLLGGYLRMSLKIVPSFMTTTKFFS